MRSGCFPKFYNNHSLRLVAGLPGHLPALLMFINFRHYFAADTRQSDGMVKEHAVAADLCQGNAMLPNKQLKPDPRGMTMGWLRRDHA
jgi:hypothetical protein